jgi:hypothetical protein
MVIYSVRPEVIKDSSFLNLRGMISETTIEELLGINSNGCGL